MLPGFLNCGAACLALASLGLGNLAAQEIRNGDFSQGLAEWKIDIPKEGKPVVAVSPDAAEGKPALKIVVGDSANLKPWKGNIQKTVNLPAAGSYTVTFLARTEPGDATVIMNAVGSGADHPNLGSIMSPKVTEEWQEFTYNLTANAPDPEATIIWRNLAVTGKTFYFANVRISKD